MTSSPSSSPSPSRSRHVALGRGLSALIPSPPPGHNNATSTPVAEAGLLRLPLEKITVNEDQPRQYFDDEAINELASSIKEHGLLQPVLVRRVDRDNYVLIAGERRWRAAQRAGLKEIPAMLSQHHKDDTLLLALVENIQRENLSPIEEAEAYQHLSEDMGLSQNEIAERVGKDRATVANTMRLLKLPEAIRDQLALGELAMGHARALLALDDEPSMLRLARESVRKKLSVRDVERRIKLLKSSGATQKTKGKAKTTKMSPAVRDVTERLQRSLSAKVSIKQAAKGRGVIEISYSSLDEFDRLLDQLTR